GDTISEGGESVVYTLQPQSAMTVIDQENGEVVAVVGGRGDKTGSKTLNRATSITRQPGSTFKIIAAFAPALDAGGMTLASVQDDAPMTYANGIELNNYDNSFGGFTTIREAIIHSINIVTAKTLTEIGTGLGYEYAQDFGISTLVSGDNNQALALGGLTNGVINMELADAYATIANGGMYHKPIFYTTVEDRDGNILLDNTKDEGSRVLKETTAWLLTDAMKQVLTEGTGKQAYFDGMAMAGKTGTTTKDRDIVFAGYTPYYTAAVWGGYDDNSPLESTIYAKTIWRAAMSRIHEGKEFKDFKKPEGIVSADVCKKSGKQPVEKVCENDPRGSMVYSEYFASGTEPSTPCDHHSPITICTKSGMPASVYCPSEYKRTGIYIIGGDPQTADGEYMLEDADAVCNIHTGSGGGMFRESDHDWDSHSDESIGGEADEDEPDEEVYDGSNVIDESEDEEEYDGTVVDEEEQEQVQE
ncbi:MAG: glycosyl transferase, partial [Lachnospiraceae bacterium]|nr:glycosyl transferase [Lachnospiraceae bacterium]